MQRIRDKQKKYRAGLKTSDESSESETAGTTNWDHWDEQWPHTLTREIVPTSIESDYRHTHTHTRNLKRCAEVATTPLWMWFHLLSSDQKESAQSLLEEEEGLKQLWVACRSRDELNKLNWDLERCTNPPETTQMSSVLVSFTTHYWNSLIQMKCVVFQNVLMF